MKLPLVLVPRCVPLSSWKDGPILLFHLARGFTQRAFRRVVGEDRRV